MPIRMFASSRREPRVRRRQQCRPRTTRGAAMCSCSILTSRSSEDTLGDLVAAMDDRPETGLVERHPAGNRRSACSRPSDGSRRSCAISENRCSRRAGRYYAPVRSSRRAPRCTRRKASSTGWSARSCFARTRAIHDVGPMDDRFFLYSEEVDWCYRFHAPDGRSRHLPLMTITHHAGRRDRGDLMAQLAYSRRLFAAKHYGAANARGIARRLALGNLLRIVVRRPGGSSAPARCSRADGLGMACIASAAWPRWVRLLSVRAAGD